MTTRPRPRPAPRARDPRPRPRPLLTYPISSSVSLSVFPIVVALFEYFRKWRESVLIEARLKRALRRGGDRKGSSNDGDRTG